MEEIADAENQDGRVRRGTRNRELILDAVLALVEAGELHPTAEQVAQQAGVGTRTLFRHFADMESLYAEMIAHIESQLRPLVGQPLPEGNLQARVAAFVDRRARLFERVSPFMLSGQSLRHGSRTLRESHQRSCRELRSELAKVFAPELGRADGQAPLIDALDLVASFEAWHRLRADQGLSRARAARTVQQSLLAILSWRG